jgi:ribosomal protein L11 methyltransferase
MSLIWWAVQFEGDELLASFALDGSCEPNAAGIEQRSTNNFVAHIKSDESGLKSFIDQMQTLGAKLISFEKTEHQNWLTLCPELFKPVKVKALTILPVISIDEAAKSTQTETKQLKIIPGLGFGTGHHESTRLALELLQSISSAPKKVLDFGCGNGILGLAANLFFASDVLGVDIEEDAIINAKDNLSINPKLKMSFRVSSLPKELGSYDLILANIFAEVLSQFRADLYAQLRPGGLIIMAGITSYSESQISSSFLEPEWIQLARIEEQGWVGLMLQRAS